jgi:hypothetical protein
MLLQAIATRDAELAARAADLLIGRGPGLTPEGDDLLAGVAAVVAAFGAKAGWGGRERGAWVDALLPPVLHRLTTPLSATLLRLAAAGQVLEPIHGLLDLGLTGAARWPRALKRLERIGHSTGPAYAVAVGATAVLAVA